MQIQLWFSFDFRSIWFLFKSNRARGDTNISFSPFIIAFIFYLFSYYFSLSMSFNFWLYALRIIIINRNEVKHRCKSNLPLHEQIQSHGFSQYISRFNPKCGQKWFFIFMVIVWWRMNTTNRSATHAAVDHLFATNKIQGRGIIWNRIGPSISMVW